MKFKYLGFFVISLFIVLIATDSADAKEVELVKNGNFESGSIYWQGDTSSIILDTIGGMNWTWFAYTGVDYDFSGIYQEDIILPSSASKIIIEFDYKYWDDNSIVGGFGTVSLHDQNNGNTVLDAAIFTDTDDTGSDMWEVESDITDLRGKTITLFAGVDNRYLYKNRLLVDNISITATVPDTTPIYRLYNTQSGVHLYTRGEADRDKILSTYPTFEFTDGAPAFYASLTDDGTTPIYRLYNTKSGVQLYTRGVADRDKILATYSEFEFTDGAPAFYASLTDDGTTPIYRLYNTKSGIHLYTRGEADRNKILNTYPTFEFTDGAPAFYASLTQ